MTYRIFYMPKGEANCCKGALACAIKGRVDTIKIKWEE